METINKKDLISIFKKSRLIREFEDDIVVPKKYFFNEIIINDENDFNKIMDQLRYFMFEELPHEIYDYVLKYKPDLSNFKDFFFEELTLLKETKKDKLTRISAIKGYLNLMIYLHENGCSWDKYTCRRAAEKGHLDCLKYARENGCSWNEWICSSAARHGKLDCLKYAHENGCSWDKWTCYYAAENDHLDCLKYAHENGCSWNKYIYKFAALSENLDCLKYAHENGCSWGSDICSYAVKYGNLDFLKYAIENNCPHDKQKCINEAKKKDHKHIIDYLESASKKQLE